MPVIVLIACSVLVFLQARMLLLALTLVIDFALQVVLASLAVVAILNGKSTLSLWKIVLPLFVIFALLEIYWIPGISALDTTIKISNQEIAQLLGSSTIPVRDLFISDGFSVAEWGLKSLISGAIIQ
jgi:hypothetical protein